MYTDIAQLEEAVRNCTKCPLHKTRKKAVPGEGTGKLGVMIVGEAPGKEEDEQGRPFVGAAGRLLTKTLAKIGVARADVYITNVVKCRPPNNRPPTSEEVEACLPYLINQITLLRPRRIVALGLVSAETLLKLIGKRAESMRELRGRCYGGRLAGVEVEICVTYHPAAVLRNPKLGDVFSRDLSVFFRGGLEQYFI
ncbi:MAG: type-4 uracil-DNA glycosylase [Pyrobaculum sp.]